MRQFQQIALGEVPDDVSRLLQLFDILNIVHLMNHLTPNEFVAATKIIYFAVGRTINAHPALEKPLKARFAPIAENGGPTQEEWDYYERWAKEAEWQNPSPPAPEKEEVKPAVKRKAGRKQQTIDNDDRMREKAKELKQLLEQKGLEPVITTSSIQDELNQVVVNFMADWAQERKALQQTAAAMVWRFLTDYCGFADSDGCAAKTWQAHVAREIPELFVVKQKKKKK